MIQNIFFVFFESDLFSELFDPLSKTDLNDLFTNLFEQIIIMSQIFSIICKLQRWSEQFIYKSGM